LVFSKIAENALLFPRVWQFRYKHTGVASLFKITADYHKHVYVCKGGVCFVLKELSVHRAKQRNTKANITFGRSQSLQTKTQFSFESEGIQWHSAAVSGQHLLLAVIFSQDHLSRTFPLEFCVMSASFKQSFTGVEFLLFPNNLFSSVKGIG
jgi:hypothetical protein